MWTTSQVSLYPRKSQFGLKMLFVLPLLQKGAFHAAAVSPWQTEIPHTLNPYVILGRAILKP